MQNAGPPSRPERLVAWAKLAKLESLNVWTLMGALPLRLAGQYPPDT